MIKFEKVFGNAFDVVLFMIVCVGVIFILSGCGNADKFVAKMTGYSTNCIEGVKYIQFPSGASVAYNTDGSIQLCK